MENKNFKQKMKNQKPLVFNNKMQDSLCSLLGLDEYKKFVNTGIINLTNSDSFDYSSKRLIDVYKKSMTEGTVMSKWFYTENNFPLVDLDSVEDKLPKYKQFIESCKNNK